MDTSRAAHLFWQLLFIAGAVCASGATCQRTLVYPFATPGPAAPQVLAENPTREQIIAAVNQNSAKIQSLSATGASITIPDMLGLPILSGNIAAERPGRFRLTAGTSFGQEIDLGSNDELFWLWVKRNQPPGVYYCQHAQFANSAIRQLMPIEPSWLLAAMGMVEIDPAQVIDGPLPSPRGPGTFELRTWLPSAGTRLQRILVIDARRAWVLEQHVYDQSGKTLIASAVAESHHYESVAQVSVPDRIAIRLPATGVNMKINLGPVQVNQLAGDRSQLWTMPTFEGYQQYNLGGAAPGTAVPGLPTARSIFNGVAPATYVISPAAQPGAAVASVYTPPPTSGPSGSIPNNDVSLNPLPQYGQRSASPPSPRPRY